MIGALGRGRKDCFNVVIKSYLYLRSHMVRTIRDVTLGFCVVSTSQFRRRCVRLRGYRRRRPRYTASTRRFDQYSRTDAGRIPIAELAGNLRCPVVAFPVDNDLLVRDSGLQPCQTLKGSRQIRRLVPCRYDEANCRLPARPHISARE